jgi:hypothetical protein
VYCTAKKENKESLGYHIDRTEGIFLSSFGWDQEKLKRELRPDKFQNLSLNDAINLRVSEGYTGGTAIVKMLFDLSKLSLAVLTMIWLKFRMIQILLIVERKTVAFAKATFGRKTSFVCRYTWTRKHPIFIAYLYP